jgi:hypothetical protein
MKLFVGCHNDDAALWGHFTLQRERPAVLTVFDSYVQVSRGQPSCDAETRRQEDLTAIRDGLGLPMFFGGVRDDVSIEDARPDVEKVLRLFPAATEVWIPAVEENGHDQHNLVGEIGFEVFAGARIHRYLTYTRTGGKSTGGTRVKCNGAMVLKKLQALACYRTQIEIEALGCWPHFLDLNEYALD